jgi:hypothetical protein
MDILYYWKNIESDLKSGKIGHFRSDREKLEVFKAGPDQQDGSAARAARRGQGMAREAA